MEMAELLQGNWILLVLALLVGVLVVWRVLAGTRRTRVDFERREEGAEPVRRNQALIDAPTMAPPASEVPPPTPAGLAGAGEAVAISAAPAPAPVPAAATPEVAAGDLARIKGVGPKLVQQLHALGVTSLAEIAAWSEADIDRIDAQLGRFQGRIRRDDWPQQARLLVAGDTAAYEAKFGRL